MKIVLNPCAVCCNRESCSRKVEAGKIQTITKPPQVDDTVQAVPTGKVRKLLVNNVPVTKMIHTRLQ